MVQPCVSDYGPNMAVLITFLSGCIIFVLGILYLGKKSHDVDKALTTWSHAAAKSRCKTSVYKNYGSKVQLAVPVFTPVEMIATESLFLIHKHIFYQEIAYKRHLSVACFTTFTCINNFYLSFEISLLQLLHITSQNTNCLRESLIWRNCSGQGFPSLPPIILELIPFKFQQVF